MTTVALLFEIEELKTKLSALADAYDGLRADYALLCDTNFDLRVDLAKAKGYVGDVCTREQAEELIHLLDL